MYACAEFSRHSRKTGYYPVTSVTHLRHFDSQLWSMAFENALSYALQVLKKSDLHVRLKPEQRQIIWHIYHGKDVFSWLPTRFGKSICYQVLPFMHDFCISQTQAINESMPSQLVMVVSPLISLMVDQVLSLRCRNVRAAILTTSDSSVDPELVATKEDLLNPVFCTAPQSHW